jgi:hypothetical protein
MKFFGYTNTLEAQPTELCEVTLCVSATELRALSAFFLKCAVEIEAAPADWEHEHFPENEKLIIANLMHQLVRPLNPLSKSGF